MIRPRLFAMLAGSSAALALAAAAPPAAAAVAPNGKIAYVAYGPADIPFGPTTQADIWTIEPDGTAAVNLTDSPTVDDTEPAFSPDGSKIAYVSDSFTRTLMVMNADGTGKTAVVDGAYSPSWGPDGTKIAIMRSREGVPSAIVIVDLATRTETIVTENATMEPVWSPDGSKIAFVDTREEQFPDPITGEPQMGAQYEIVVVNTDGTGEVIVSAGAPGSDRANYLEEDRAPAWSPDGTKLVFMSQSQVPACCGPWQLWAVNADGTGITNLTADDTLQDLYPSWSPDGTSIVFNRAGPLGYDLYTMPAPAVLPVPATLSALTARAAIAAVTGSAVPLTTNGNASDPSWGALSSVASHRLTVIKHGLGNVVSTPAGINCGSECTKSFTSGATVTLKALPAKGWRFDRWSGACSGQKVRCVITVGRDRRAAVWFVRR